MIFYKLAILFLGNTYSSRPSSPNHRLAHSFCIKNQNLFYMYSKRLHKILGLIGKSHCEINPADWAHMSDFLLQVNPDSIYSKRKRGLSLPFGTYQKYIDDIGMLGSNQ